MDNKIIANHFSLLSQLMEIHGENSFRAKSYAAAAFTIKKLPLQLSELPNEQISSLKGIGTSSAEKIREILTTGKISQLEKLLEKTPEGVVEMLQIKGMGPKKIYTIWKEMEIENPGELLYACLENRLKLYKGFGEKTQQNIIEAIQYYLKNKEWHLYSQVEIAEPLVTEFLQKVFPNAKIFLTGAFLRQVEIIQDLEYLIAENKENILNSMHHVEGFSFLEAVDDWIRFKGIAGINIKLFPTEEKDFERRKIETSFSEDFLHGLKIIPAFPQADYSSDQHFFSSLSLPVIPYPLREGYAMPEWVKQNGIPPLITAKDIRGIIHSHSNWSDGASEIEEMAMAAKEKGFEYLVISDHSKAAFYANGLTVDRVKAQHEYIDEINARLAPFRIFKSIESDILNDGSLDYPEEILASFDLVIASIHSNLKMNIEKAMQRLLAAIRNPFTTILGHMTGRLLLAREGYPLNVSEVIDACRENQVTIELNANPNRLDIDWRHIREALDKGVMISINPDAHYIESFSDIRYGVITARKAGVSKFENLSSLGLGDFEKYITERKIKKTI